MKMDKVLVGNLSAKGEQILTAYLDKFLPNAERTNLQKTGVRAKIKTVGKRPDTILIILDGILYDECLDNCKDILSLPKVHRYEDDEGLSRFLIEKFGKIDDLDLNKDDTDEFAAFDNSSSIVDDTEFEAFSSVETLSSTIYGNEDDTNTSNEEILHLQEENKQQAELISQLSAGSSTDTDDTIRTLTETITKLKGQLKQQEEQIKTMEQENLISLGKVTKADSVLEELNSLKASCSGLKDTISELTYEKTKLIKENEGLTIKANESVALSEELQKTKVARDRLKTDLATLQIKFDANKTELAKLKGLKDTLEQSLSTEKGKVIELDKQVATLTEGNKNISDALTTLQEDQKRVEQLSKQKDTRLKTLEVELSSIKESVADKDNTLTELSTENSEYIHKCSEQKAELEASKKTVTDLKKQVSELRVENTALKTEKQNANTYKSKAEVEIETYKSNLQEKDDEIAELKASIDDLQAAQDNSSQHAKEEYNACQAEIASLKAANQELKSKMFDYDDMATRAGKEPEYKQQISSLKKQVQELEQKNIDIQRNNSKVAGTNDAKYRAKIAELEEDNKTLQETMNEMSRGVYPSLQNSSLPKVKLQTTLDLGNTWFGDYYVFGSASTYSNATAYKEIRRGLEYSTKKCVVLDLSMDSYIDMEFKPRGVKNPLDWLSGRAEPVSALSQTAFDNVSVISLGLSFINPLYLLEIDWQKRLESLKSCAEVVIVYTGCLTDMVARVLYQSFITVMNGYLIVHATPINLRTAMLTLAGMLNTDKIQVGCVNIGAGSESLLNTLQNKYKTVIWDNKNYFIV